MYNLSKNLIKLGKKYDFEPIATGGNIDFLNYWQNPTQHFVLGSAEDVGWGNVTLEEPVVLCCYQKSDEDWIDAKIYQYENAEAAMKHIYETKGNLEK